MSNQEPFDPKTKKYPYPKDTSAHYIKIKKNLNLNIDASYPYIDTSKSFLFKQRLVRFVMRTLVIYLSKIKLGLRIKGRKNIRKNKDILKKGVISCSNHVNFWDYIAILDGIRPFKPKYLVWERNIQGENSKLIRLTGGIPIPTNIGGTKVFVKTINDFIHSGGWLHIYPEGSMWEYYQPIRPFKRGASHFAIKNDKPIIPLAFSYRKPGFIRKKLFHQEAKYTLHIGELLYRNESLPFDQQEEDLTIRCHQEICKLAGIDPKENKYPPIFDNTTRVDYY